MVSLDMQLYINVIMIELNHIPIKFSKHFLWISLDIQLCIYFKGQGLTTNQVVASLLQPTT